MNARNKDHFEVPVKRIASVLPVIDKSEALSYQSILQMQYTLHAALKQKNISREYKTQIERCIRENARLSEFF